MSSNFFFRAAGSDKGQLDSSWWQKMTFSRIALETPSSNGTSSSISEHFVEIVFRYSPSAARPHLRYSSELVFLQVDQPLTLPSPPSASVLANIPSSVFILNAPVFFVVTWRFLVAVMRCLLTFQNRSLTCAFTSFSFAIFGSCTNAPPLVLGGRSPVVAYLRHSMIV